MKKNSLVFRTILISSGLTLLSLLIILFISVNSSTKSLKTTIAEELENKSTMTGHNIDNYFEERIRDIRKISQADVLESNNKQSIIQYFEELMDADPSSANI